MVRLKFTHRLIILAGVFLIALAVWFALSQSHVSEHEEVYSATLKESELPVVWVTMFDRKMNCMRGYTDPVSSDIAYDTLTILPEDRRLHISVEEGRTHISEISYEIRSADVSELIEKTKITDSAKNGNDIEVELPIQNLLIKGKEYRLDVILTTEARGDVHYYTRILLTDETETAKEMLDLVSDFSRRNFDYEQARENTKYVETDGTADDATLAYTNLKSTFAKLAYGNLKLEVTGQKDLRLCVYDGNTGEAHISFLAARRVSDSKTELYEIEETYSLRMGAVRLYMMNYSRRMHEIFRGDIHDLGGKRIQLGINDESDLQSMESSDGRYIYYVCAKDIWGYDSAEQSIKNIFSFRNSAASGMVDNFEKHDIRILKVTDTGNVVFLVYGYMNRGAHEGQTGISYMTYDAERNLVDENFFIPVARNYEYIKQDVETLSYIGSNNIFYFMADGNFYALDTLSASVIALAVNQKDGTYSVSKNMDKLAWQTDGDRFGSSAVNVLDMDTGKKREIRAEEGVLIKPEGFIGRDLAVTLRSRSDAWYVNGKLRMIPARILQIVDDELRIMTSYEKDSIFLDDIVVKDGRVNMQFYSRTVNEDYIPSGEDTIVSSTEAPDRREGVGFYNAEDKFRVYYIDLNSEIERGSVSIAPETDITDRENTINGITLPKENRFAAYGDGQLIGRFDEAVDAVDAAYSQMGTVRYRGNVFYNRPAKVVSRYIDDPDGKAEDIRLKLETGELLDIKGLELKQVLYFISMRMPVLAYDSGEPLMIYGYNSDSVSVYHLKDGTKEKIGMEKAEELFEADSRDFSCDFTFDR